MKFTTISASALAILTPVGALNHCPPVGAVLPIPTTACNNTVSKISTSLTEAINNVLNNPATAPFNTSTTSFSVTVTTVKKTIFQYHHTAPHINQTGAQKVEGDTVYRIASVTKVFVVLSALIQEGVDLDAYVWEHVPELAGNADYKDITLRMLAYHLSGVPRDLWAFDLSSNVPPQVFKKVGFPAVTPPADYPICDGIGTRYCSRAEFFQGLTGKDNKPVWLPGQKPAYSNVAYILLGFAIVNATGKSLHDVVGESITRPLNLTAATGFTPPQASDIIIPVGDGGAMVPLYEFKNWDGTAGMWSTPNDLATFARGVLNSALLPRAETAQWLKPASFTSSPGGVGAPWNIIRPSNVRRASGERPLEILASLGGVPPYGAYLALIPEYNAAVIVNVATPGDGDVVLKTIVNLAVQAAIPALDDVARANAAAKYAGSYGGASTNGSSLVLTLDDGPGLGVRDWTVGGKSMRDAWMALSGDGANMGDVSIRIYPIGGADDRWQVTFRGIPKFDETDSIYGTACDTWFDSGRFRYSGLVLDEFRFEAGEDGKVSGLTIPGFRQTLAKGN